MSTVVTKSAPLVVRPSQSTPNENIKLTAEVALAGIYVTLVLVFDNPIHEPAQTIKRAMSPALVHYYPIAGRLEVAGREGELTLACNGEGVQFVAASTTSTLEHARLIEKPFMTDLVKDLVVCSPGRSWRHSDPLLLMQVTEFSCGGFILGVTWNHVIADGQGMAQFMVAIGELACGLSPLSVIPVRSDKSLETFRPSASSQWQQMGNSDDLDLSILDITLPPGLISSIKSDYARNYNGLTCTQFAVTTAAFWQCRTRVTMSDPDTPAPLLFAVDMRKHIGAKVGYYGNCLTAQVVVATNNTVASSPIRDLVKLIMDAKDKIPDMVDCTSSSSMEGIGKMSIYDILIITSWRNLGFEAVDFGSGRPARVTCHREPITYPFCVLCPPCKVKDGANVTSICVKEEHVQDFLD